MMLLYLEFSNPLHLLKAGKPMFILLSLLMLSGLYYSQLPSPPRVMNLLFSSTLFRKYAYKRGYIMCMFSLKRNKK